MKKHILTISVEDYFHVAALRGAVLRKHWDRLEPHLDDNIADVLDLLDKYGHKATFFVLGSIAEVQPELVQRIRARGHEIACSGYFPREMKSITPAEFRKEVRLTREIVEDAAGCRVHGFRSPSWMRRDQLWMLDVLAEEGYRYDSSINPALQRFIDRPEVNRIHQHRHSLSDARLWELPITTVNLFGLQVATGGNYIRQFPHTFLAPAVEKFAQREERPLIFYFMPWEIDRKQPQIQGISRLQRIRHYRNLGKTRWALTLYFQSLQFQGIADYLKLSKDEPAQPRARTPELRAAAGGEPENWRAEPEAKARCSSEALPRRMPVEKTNEKPAPVEDVSLVVPMYNEEQNVKYLQRTLLAFRRRCAAEWRFHLVLVDDRSTDQTWKMLNEIFGDVPDVKLVRHEQNQGVAAALMTGIRAAPTEIVCTIDCDCSYDPHNFEEMIPLLKARDADMVTASPYHPAGHVLNVPEWRLFLSKTLSKMYSAVLKDRLHTFTSCCRVVKKSAMERITVEHGGFLGVAEMLIDLKLRGGRVIEYPATLESRLLGESKMKVARTIRAHLGLLGDLTIGKRGQT